MALSFGIILVCILLFLAVRPKKSPAVQPLMQATPFFQDAPAPAPVAVSFRQQMVDEKAAEVASAFKDAEQKKWRKEVIKEAAELLAVE
jgi:hypothetical protein